MKKLLSLILALSMVLTLFSVIAFAEDEEPDPNLEDPFGEFDPDFDGEEDPEWNPDWEDEGDYEPIPDPVSGPFLINGQTIENSITLTNADTEYGIQSGTITYNKTAKTVTFDNVTLNITDDEASFTTDLGLKLILIGKNTIKISSGEDSNIPAAFYTSSEAFTIESQDKANPASLTIDSGDIGGFTSSLAGLTINDVNIEYKGTMTPIVVGQAPLTINNSTITAKAEGLSYGIMMICFDDEIDASLKVTNSTLDFKTDRSGISCAQDISFKDSTVTIDVAPDTEYNSLRQSLLGYKNITIDDSVVNIKGSLCLDNMMGGTPVLTMNSGELIITATDNSAIVGSGAIVNINGGLTKLMVKGNDETSTIFLKDYDGTSKINCSKVKLLEEGQKVITDTQTMEYEDDTETLYRVAMGTDKSEFSEWAGTRDITPGVTSSTFLDLKYTEGQGQTVTQGNSAVFKLNLDNKYATGEVLIDGQKVLPANFTITHGSTIVTFTKEYMASLKPGTHTLTVKFDIYGTEVEESTVFTVAEAIANTSDSSQTAAVITLLCSVTALAATTIKRKIDE